MSYFIRGTISIEITYSSGGDVAKPDSDVPKSTRMLLSPAAGFLSPGKDPWAIAFPKNIAPSDAGGKSAKIIASIDADGKCAKNIADEDARVEYALLRRLEAGCVPFDVPVHAAISLVSVAGQQKLIELHVSKDWKFVSFVYPVS